jgi:CelD/BcsL family acetyltransferase involved in cellulose biosynthesis
MPQRLHLHDRLESIEANLEEWSLFSSRCKVAAPFCDVRVWASWLRSHPHLEPAVYEWSAGGERKAILPFYRRGHHLEMAAGPHLDYQDLLALDRESAVAALLATVARESHRSTSLWFPKVAAHSRLAEALDDPRLGTLAHLEHRFWSRCPVTSIPKQSGKDFLASLPSRHRKDFRNADRRLLEVFPSLVAEHHGPGRFPASLVEEVADLHRRNQYRKAGPSVCEDDAFISFLKDQAGTESGLCLSLVRPAPGAAPIAFNLGYFAGNTFHYYLTAYAGEQARLSPGRWLLIDTLRHWHERVDGPALRFDMLCGEEEYKSRWHATSYEVSRVVLIPRRIVNLPRILAYSAVYGLKNAKNRRLLNRPDRGRLHEPEPADVVLPG